MYQTATIEERTAERARVAPQRALDGYRPDRARRLRRGCRLLGLALIAVALPAPVAAAPYLLAGTSDGTGKILVDDGLTVELNGTPIYSDGTDPSGLRDPIPFDASLGDSLRFVLHDTFGTCATLSRIYLIDALGRSTIATAGYSGGCSNPGVDRGVVFETTFVVTDLTLLAPGYTEGLLPGAALAGVVRGPGGFLYGVTYEDGDASPDDRGVLYRISPDLGQVDVLHEFDGTDGAAPVVELTLAGAKLYGHASIGGASYGGTVFEFDTTTGVLTTLRDFGFGGPYGFTGPLLVIGDWIYGTTIYQGTTVFRLRTDGSEYETLHDLSTEDGQAPGGLIAGPDGWLYGAAQFGGFDCFPPVAWDGCGTIFRLRPEKDASGSAQFQVLHLFLDRFTAYPQRKLVLGSDGRLYGTTYRTVFSLNPDGTDFRVVYELEGPGSQIFAPPIEGLDGRLYVAQYDGGAAGVGLVFSVSKAGTDATTHHEFTLEPGTGFAPYGTLWQDAPGTIFGTTEYSGTTGEPGTVFQIRGVAQGPATASAAIGEAGGTLATADGSVEVIVPPGALSQPTAITIEGGLASSEYGVGTSSTRALVVRLGPAGTTFAVPVTVRLRWNDTSPEDGLVDGLLTPESQLRIYKNGVAITAQCQLAPAPGSCPTCCDPVANRWELAVSSFSEFVVLHEAAPPAECVALDAPKLTLGKILAPPGDDTLVLRGNAALPPGALDLDPVAEGLGVLVADAGGTIVDETIPPGAFVKATKTGWKVNEKGTRWTFTAPPGSGPAGLSKAKLVLKDGVLKASVIGARGSYAGTPPLEVRLVLPASSACLESAFDVGEQTCKVKNNGKTIACK